MKIWLKDNDFAADVSGSLIDIIRDKVRDRRNQIDVERVFQDLDFEVERRLLKAFPHEYREIPENDRLATVHAVRGTIEAARLDQDDLFAADLDPRFLKAHIETVTKRQPANDLSADAVELYDDILDESCVCIVEASRRLPGFSTAAFTELLRRQSALLNAQSSMARDFQDLLLRLPTPQPDLSGSDAEAAAFEGIYRIQIGGILDTLHLFGVTVTTAKYDLTSAYVSISAQSNSSTANVAGGQPIEDTIAQHARIFLRAPAGYGKTTILQWTAVRAAYRDFPSSMDSLNNFVPFYIPLRNYAATELPQPPEFVRRAGRHLGEQMPPGWVEQVLSAGRGLILIDGADEVPEQRRTQVKAWISRLTADFPNSRFIVSTRPEATAEDWLTHEDFTSTHLLQLSDRGIDRLVRRWYRAAANAIADGDERDRIQGLSDPLLETINLERHLRRIASVPLMCALLCALHRDGYDVRRSDRQEVYDKALDMLIELRDTARGVSVDEIGLSRKDKISIMRDLAYWLRRNKLVDVDRTQVIAHLARLTRTLVHVDASPQSIYEHLLHRSGLLQELTVNVMSFVHRSFQDYLTAQAMIEADDIGVLVESAHDRNWQDIVVMAAGYASRPVQVRLLEGIVRRSDSEQENQRSLGLVAVACVAVVSDLPKTLQSAIEERAKELVPPTTMEEAAKLATAGPLVLEALEAKPPSTSAQVAAAVRVARLIGGEDSLRYIAKFKDDDSPAVRTEIVDAWQAFDPTEFARIMLPSIREITITNPSLMAGITHLTGVESLSLKFIDEDIDLSFIDAMPKLKSLEIESNAYLDLAPLVAASPKLESLTVTSNKHVYMRQLPDIKGLRRIGIGRTYFGTGLGILSKCVTLDILTLFGDADLATLQVLSGKTIRIAGAVRKHGGVEATNTIEIVLGGRLVERPTGSGPLLTEYRGG